MGENEESSKKRSKLEEKVLEIGERSGKSITFSQDAMMEFMARVGREHLLKLMLASKGLYRMVVESEPFLKDRFLNPLKDEFEGILSFDDGNGLFSLQTDETTPSGFIFKKFSDTNFQIEGIQSNFPSMLRSVDGLLCFVEKKNNNFYVCNPTIKECRMLPLHPLLPFVKKHTGYGFGFCYSPLKQHKVVVVSSEDCICCSYETDPIRSCFIHTIGTTSWRQIQCPSCPIVDDSVFVDGTMYWLVKSLSDGTYRIVCFDVAEEVFYNILPPLVEDKGYKIMQLAHMNNELCLLDWVHYEDDSPGAVKELHLWRRSSSGVWEILHQISIVDFFSLDDVGVLEIDHCFMNWTIQVLKVGEQKILFRVGRSGFYCFDVNNKSVEIVSGMNVKQAWMQSTWFEPTLTPLRRELCGQGNLVLAAGGDAL